MKTKVLSNLPFIYRDGNHYRFTVFQEDYSGLSEAPSYQKHFIHLDKRSRPLTIKVFKWSKTFFFYSVVCDPFEVQWYKSDNPEEIRSKITREITFALRAIEEKKAPKPTTVEKAFTTFDGFIDVPHNEKAKYKRVDTIKEIIK